ncbi:MAG: hypothetical protein Q8Q09_26970 [Deltaproteobacteria bacterium]|nr:hypothetical protein [Deltaproteobacteria bacterium]
MSDTPTRHENLKKGLPVALAGFLAILVPAMLTLNTVKSPGTLTITSANPTPLGYTISLSLFIVPSALLLFWLLRHPEARIERKAFFATITAIFFVGCVLDFFFAYSFFYYSNQAATLGIRLPAFSFGDWSWHRDNLPIEEFGFYSFGGFFMTALYVWADLSWMPQRKFALMHSEVATEVPKKFPYKFDWRVAAVGIVLIVCAIAYRKLFVSEPGFPGYFVFLMCIGFIPTVMLFETAGPLVNWQAFTLMFTVLQLVSLIWEATLGVPYNWWNYHHGQMIGIFIGAWAQLPVESVLMWILGGWATVIAYESFRVGFYWMEQREFIATSAARSTLDPGA